MPASGPSRSAVPTLDLRLEPRPIPLVRHGPELPVSLAYEAEDSSALLAVHISLNRKSAGGTVRFDLALDCVCADRDGRDESIVRTDIDQPFTDPIRELQIGCFHDGRGWLAG